MQSIADVVTAILPWAWEELKAAFNSIAHVFQYVIKRPMFVIQEIGNGIARYVTMTKLYTVLFHNKQPLIVSDIHLCLCVNIILEWTQLVCAPALGVYL